MSKRERQRLNKYFKILAFYLALVLIFFDCLSPGKNYFKRCDYYYGLNPLKIRKTKRFAQRSKNETFRF